MEKTSRVILTVDVGGIGKYLPIQKVQSDNQTISHAHRYNHTMYNMYIYIYYIGIHYISQFYHALYCIYCNHNHK